LFYFEIILLILFIALTAIGYKKTNRNMMLLGSICLLIASAGEPFRNGFNEGFAKSRAEHEAKSE